jgi:hypothetical protein
MEIVQKTQQFGVTEYTFLSRTLFHGFAIYVYRISGKTATLSVEFVASGVRNTNPGGTLDAEEHNCRKGGDV